MSGVARRAVAWLAIAWCLACAGESAVPSAQVVRPPIERPADALPDSAFAALHARISEEGGYFDTDNLISNETGYLNVVGALAERAPRGGAFVGVGPDQSYSYIAVLEPRLAFLVDIRRDNALQHLLLKALVERAPTRIEFLAGLHGRAPPPEGAAAWEDRSAAELVAWIEARPPAADLAALQEEIGRAVQGYGIPLDSADHATIRRFHRAFVDGGPGLRFTSYGRPPRPYYPTYGQLVAETDASGRPASYLASADAYRRVRALHLANRIVPVVGDLAGPHALREMGEVMRERGLELTAFYTSNVEFYLWRGGTFDRWAGNLAALPAHEDALVIRSYFPNFGRGHPSALPGYYATQTLQPVATVVQGGFTSYWDVVTRDVLELEVAAGAGR